MPFRILMKQKLKLQLLVAALVCLPILARAQGTAFSYQGHLQFQGAAGNGTYDFIFALFDDPVTGTQVGLNLPLNTVAVSNGLFNVALDFGPGAFTGNPRWLEINVRPSGTGPFTKLAGRASLLPTPYAIFAAKAGSVAAGTVTANQLNTGGLAPTAGQFLTFSGGNLLWADPGVAAGNIWSKSGADTYYSAGNVGMGLSSPTPGIRLEVNGNVRFHPNGGIPGGFVQFGTPNGETGMSITGSNRADIRFDGYTLKLLAGLGAGSMPSENGIAITTGGNVGIGTTTPAAGFKFDVTGLTRLNPGGSGGEVWFHTPNGETGMSLVGLNRADVRFDGLSLKLVAGFGPGAMPSENGIAITTGGNVGIGTTNPVAKLDVESSLAGKVAAYGRETGINAVGVYGEATASSGVGVVAHNPGGVALQADGNAVQSRDKGGFVKAMVYVDDFGTILRSYSGVPGPPITVEHRGSGINRVNFGFQVDDRFISITPHYGGGNSAGYNFGANFTFFNSTTVDVLTFNANDGDDTFPDEFMIFVF